MEILEMFKVFLRISIWRIDDYFELFKILIRKIIFVTVHSRFVLLSTIALVVGFLWLKYCRCCHRIFSQNFWYLMCYSFLVYFCLSPYSLFLCCFWSCHEYELWKLHNNRQLLHAAKAASARCCMADMLALF